MVEAFSVTHVKQQIAQWRGVPPPHPPHPALVRLRLSDNTEQGNDTAADTFSFTLREAAMLSPREKELIAEIWQRMTPVAEDIGAEALLRMFATQPGSKTYFSHLDISPSSAHLRSHGKKIVLAIAEGAKDISQLAITLGPLQTLHAYQLRIDPTNFKVPLQEHHSSHTVCSSPWRRTCATTSHQWRTQQWTSTCQRSQPCSPRNSDETQPRVFMKYVNHL
ncbi:hypothetical protein FQN60_002779 [Etheostoma spectabile]|uniref:Globin domain-containing protein n=1 Tax=Etheostoma spectabile TaxID=54343 RepID=A0A5J5CHC1_9PERO|nr:hypothetical protein FQN60_002779 [Etheostoma spectabile]